MQETDDETVKAAATELYLAVLGVEQSLLINIDVDCKFEEIGEEIKCLAQKFLSTGLYERDRLVQAEAADHMAAVLRLRAATENFKACAGVSLEVPPEEAEINAKQRDFFLAMKIVAYERYKEERERDSENNLRRVLQSSLGLRDEHEHPKDEEANIEAYINSAYSLPKQEYLRKHYEDIFKRGDAHVNTLKLTVAHYQALLNGVQEDSEEYFSLLSRELSPHDEQRCLH